MITCLQENEWHTSKVKARICSAIFGSIWQNNESLPAHEPLSVSNKAIEIANKQRENFQQSSRSVWGTTPFSQQQKKATAQPCRGDVPTALSNESGSFFQRSFLFFVGSKSAGGMQLVPPDSWKVAPLTRLQCDYVHHANFVKHFADDEKDVQVRLRCSFNQNIFYFEYANLK